MKRFYLLWLAGMVALMPLSAHADTDKLIEGAKLCTRHLPRYEREYGIPTHLLSAIASTESGRYHEGLGIKVPWPWTINANGKGYVYESKQEAIAAVHQLRARGIESIDVGCMQVNLYHHPEAFRSLDQAFEPQTNIAYAASFLRDLYQQGGSWRKAAGDYHSKTRGRGEQYASQVYDSWYQIIDKLRAAHLQVASSQTVMAANEVKPVLKSPVKITRHLPEHEGKTFAAYTPPRMNSIKVSAKDPVRIMVWSSSTRLSRWPTVSR